MSGLNVQAPDFHAERCQSPRPADDSGRVRRGDRGLAAFAVASTADGTEVGRWQAPKPLRRGMVGLRRRSCAASRSQPRSCNQAKAIRRLSRQERPHRRHPPQLPPCDAQPTRQDPRPALPGRPRRRQPHGQPASGPRHRRRRLGRVRPPTRLQGGMVRSRTDRLRPLVPIHQNLLAVWNDQATHGVGRADLSLRRLRPCHRPGPQRLPRTSPPGPSVATPTPRTAKRAARQPTPLEEGTGHRPGDGGTDPTEGGTDAHALMA